MLLKDFGYIIDEVPYQEGCVVTLSMIANPFYSKERNMERVVELLGRENILYKTEDAEINHGKILLTGTKEPQIFLKSMESGYSLEILIVGARTSTPKSILKRRFLGSVFSEGIAGSLTSHKVVPFD